MAAINHPYGLGRKALPRVPILGRPNWWVLGAAAIVAVSAMLPVVQNSSATSRGFELQALRAEQAVLRGELGQLESDVARLTSLYRIERRATEIGLIPATKPVYVTVTEAGPAPAQVPAEYLPAEAPETGKPESWWQSLFGWLPLID
jgi:hypothetical protein